MRRPPLGPPDSDIPVPVQGLPGIVTAVSAGGHSSLAMLNGGSVAAWGDNALGQLGNGSTSGSTVMAGTLVLGCRSPSISGGDWLISGAEPGMNHTSLLPVVVDVVPVCRSKPLPWGWTSAIYYSR